MITLETEIGSGRGRVVVHDLVFLMRAVGRAKDSERFALNAIQATSINGVRVLISTDGTRLHMIENIYSVPDGLYRPIESKREKVICLELINDRFPDCSTVLNFAEHTSSESRFVGGEKLSASMSVAKLFHAYHGAIRLDYLSDLGPDVFDAWFSDDPQRPVYFVNCSKVAVLMPIRTRTAING